MKDIILLKQGEVVLKGLNKRYFEQKLLANIRKRLKHMGNFRVYCVQSTVYVEPEDESADMDEAFEAMRHVFGIIALTRAAACEKNEDAIFEKAREYLRDDMENARSFKVETRRSDKSFHMTSIQLSQYVGGLLADAFPDTRVDVRHPELVVHLEVRDYAAYVHAAPTPGAGGMPVGSNGRAITLLSGGIDSPVSSYMIARRGVKLVPVHFLQLPLHQRGGQGEGRRARAAAGARLRADVPAGRALHAHTGGDAQPSAPRSISPSSCAAS